MIIITLSENVILPDDLAIDKQRNYIKTFPGSSGPAWLDKSTYITKIEYIDNEYNQILLLDVYYKNLEYYNLDMQLHNDIGYATIYYNNDGSIQEQEYWLNGQYRTEKGWLQNRKIK